MKIAILLILLIGVGILFFKKGNNLDESKFSVIEIISKDNFKAAISADPSIQLVDVRKQGEWDNGHIQQAVCIDYFSRNFVDQFQKFDKQKPLYLYCRSGNRSGKGARLLSQEGFTKIYDLEGGYLNWAKD